MGSFANTLFSALLGWVQSVASSIWAFFSDERGGGLLKWIGEHWLPLAAFFCLCGIALDLAFTLHLKRNNVLLSVMCRRIPATPRIRCRRRRSLQLLISARTA